MTLVAWQVMTVLLAIMLAGAFIYFIAQRTKVLAEVRDLTITTKKQLKEAKDKVIDAEAMLEQCRDLVARTQAGAAGQLATINEMEQLIQDMIDISAHQFIHDPDECAMCRAYHQYRLSRKKG